MIVDTTVLMTLDNDNVGFSDINAHVDRSFLHLNLQ